MKKFMILAVFTLVFSLGMSVKTVKAEDGERQQVTLSSMEEVTYEEAEEAFENAKLVPRISPVSGESYLSTTKDKIIVSLITFSNIGPAEEIGTKFVSIQYREPGSDLYANSYVDGDYVGYNEMEYASSYEITDPMVGYYYRGKQKHYIIVNGVEYYFYSYTNEVLFTGK